MNKNSVKYLQNISFSSLTFEEKCEIKSLGRDTPDLVISQASSSRNQTYTRKFNSSTYFKHKWMCGCSEKNVLFCFPCLLFGGDVTWTKTGVNDLKHLREKVKKHEDSAKHIKNVVDLAMIGKVNIACQLSDVYRQQTNKHNEKVRQNREILSKIIDCIKFCGKFELPLRGHVETSQSSNPGVFRGLLQFAGKLNDPLENHFLNSKVFRGTSKTIQNELLDCILEVCREEICAEIKQSKFLSVMSDDTTDVSGHTQQVIVFRHEAKEVCDTISYQIKERFTFNKHLSAAKLLNFSLFQDNINYIQFSSLEIEETIQAYPFLCKERLKTELSVLYQKQEFRNISGLLKMYGIMLDSGIGDSCTEVLTLLKIILTTPMTTAQPERCFSTLKRMKTFLRSTMTQDRLAALAMLSVEKVMIENIINFNDKVINKFSSRKERRLDIKLWIKQ